MPRVPGSLILTFGLIALGGVGAGASLGVQRWKTVHEARAFAAQLTGGDPKRGEAAFKDHGCGACHAIIGLQGADGQVGPALDKVATRAFIAGDQPNQPAQMVAWLRHPQAIRPGSGMPDLGLDEATARDLAAYLYTLR